MATQEVVNEINALVTKWKDKQGNLIMILHELQNHYGYVPREASLELSKILHVPLARIYEVITFYNFFKLEPPGKHTIAVCMGTACYLKGAPRLLAEIKNILNVEEGRTTKDGLFYLDVVRCLGCCGLSPVIKIDDKVYGKVTKNEIVDILSKYGKQGQ
ncbi:MAG TPA: NAD(P)H-dependent oxidoreductase subunit E [Candidatus Omnitrophota bacterium]|nr:NAD(P)H-dependent oxidoreductase subunit E [Candidatus Omnitrophota bacterium]HPT07481.1 NAD(P)H-dependent oxidoreductase subunit E [Candidatus Omnitrophota bacterium]